MSSGLLHKLSSRSDMFSSSTLSINEQSAQVETLKKIVRGTEQFQQAEAEGKLLRLPTGDGGALVFRNHSESAGSLCDGNQPRVKESSDNRCTHGHSQRA